VINSAEAHAIKPPHTGQAAGRPSELIAFPNAANPQMLHQFPQTAGLEQPSICAPPA